jgi:hypothetical protein
LSCATTLPVSAETGGILFGLVAVPAKRIHLVDATPAPPDSHEELVGFVRGVAGVSAIMDEVRLRTIGQVRYVGEWHSHPPRSSARLSAVDGVQTDWLAALMDMDCSGKSTPPAAISAVNSATVCRFSPAASGTSPSRRRWA